VDYDIPPTYFRVAVIVVEDVAAALVCAAGGCGWRGRGCEPTICLSAFPLQTFTLYILLLSPNLLHLRLVAAWNGGQRRVWVG
jgi:hypothetical protein